MKPTVRLFKHHACTIPEVLLAVFLCGLATCLFFGFAKSINLDTSSAAHDSKMAIGTLAAILAAVAWLVKRILNYLRLRAELVIFDILSDGTPRTLQLIEAEATHLRRFQWLYVTWIPGAIIDALAGLVERGKIDIIKNQYSLASKPASQPLKNEDKLLVDAEGLCDATESA